MLTLTLVLLAQIGNPQGVRLLDDAPLLAQATPALIPNTDAEVSAQQLQVDLDALKRARPSLGGGIALVSAGGGASLLGALYLALSAGFGGFGLAINPFLIIGGVALGVGLPLVMLGVWLLYNRLDERKRIDDETKSLKLQLQQRPPLQRQQQRPYSPPYSPPPPVNNVPAPQVLGPDASMVLALF